MNILRLPDVKNKTGLSTSQIYALMKERKFPRQIELGLRAVGWLSTEIEEWLEGKINKSRLSNKKY